MRISFEYDRTYFPPFPITDEVLVGRDVLNQLMVMLNGLAHVTEISD